jgi:hypothetical protein
MPEAAVTAVRQTSHGGVQRKIPAIFTFRRASSFQLVVLLGAADNFPQCIVAVLAR